MSIAWNTLPIKELLRFLKTCQILWKYLWVLVNRLLHILHIIVLILSLECQKMGKQNLSSRNIYIPIYNCRRGNLKSSFVSASLGEWLNLDPSKFYQSIQTTLIRLLENSIFNIFDSEGLKLLTRLSLDFSHLKERRFRHNYFRKCLNALCTCSLETKNTSHYLLHCHHLHSLLYWSYTSCKDFCFWLWVLIK